jgi:hypothetical protein
MIKVETQSQTTEEKLHSFLSAIDSIENFEDGSIIINWKSNVAHNVNGHLVTTSTQTQVQQGLEIHLNPTTASITFDNIDEQLSQVKESE